MSKEERERRERMEHGIYRREKEDGSGHIPILKQEERFFRPLDFCKSYSVLSKWIVVAEKPASLLYVHCARQWTWTGLPLRGWEEESLLVVVEGQSMYVVNDRKEAPLVVVCRYKMEIQTSS